MYIGQSFNSSHNNPKDVLRSLKLKYTINNNSDHHDLLKAYGSVQPQNNPYTHRLQQDRRSPLKNMENLYETNQHRSSNYKKSIIEGGKYENNKANTSKERCDNSSLQRKPSFMGLTLVNADRSLSKARESIKIQRPQCSIRRVNTTYDENKTSKQTLRQEKENFNQCDSPIKLIYKSNQNEQESYVQGYRFQPQAKSNQIADYYKLQRQKTTKTISSIQNILNSIRNTLNK